MSFHEVLFLSCCEIFLVGRSLFSTSKIVCASGREIRNLDHGYHRGLYLLKDCFLSQNEFWMFNNFFKALRGSRFAFLLRDFADANRKQLNIINHYFCSIVKHVEQILVIVNARLILADIGSYTAFNLLNLALLVYQIWN